MASGTLMSLQEFRDKRDQHALDGFKLRWPILNGKKQVLRKQIDTINVKLATFVLSVHGKEAFAGDKLALQQKYGEVVSEMALIEADAPIRKMNLGLMPVPDQPTPEMKLRLTLFMLQLSKDMLMKGMPI